MQSHSDRHRPLHRYRASVELQCVRDEETRAPDHSHQLGMRYGRVIDSDMLELLRHPHLAEVRIGYDIAEVYTDCRNDSSMIR